MFETWRAGLIFLTIGGSAALAHSGATGIVKERMDVMMDIAAGMKTVGAMFKGTTAFDADRVADTATRLAGHATSMARLFPPGTNPAPSEARAEIWTDWDRFVAMTGQMNGRALSLAAAASTATSTRDIRSAFTDLGATCKNCHQAFREKK